MTQYSDWQQSVDGPDELSQEEQVKEGMSVLYAKYGVLQLMDKLCASRSQVIAAFYDGRASGDFIAAMNRLANEGVEIETPVSSSGEIEF